MSSRWYPLYQRGNPQLRVFLPNFWLKLIRPERKMPENIVTFETSMQMTEYDIKSYLEKIYQIPVIHIRTRIAMGKTERDRGEGYVIKKEDRKLAYVTLPKEVQFTFPDLYPSDAEAKKQRRDDEKSLDHSKDTFKKYLDRSKARRGLPAWFSI